MSAWSKPSWPIRAAVHAFVYILAATMLVPFAWMCSTSLKTDAEAIDVQQVALLPAGSVSDWKWGNYLEAWRLAELGDVYLNSLIVAVVVTVLSVLHNALAGFAFAKLRMTAKRSVFIAMLMTMMLPYQVYFLFAYVLCGWLGYVDHLHALIVPFLASAFGIFYMRQSIITVSDGLLDAGRVDGLTNFELFWHVVLPSIRPAVVRTGTPVRTPTRSVGRLRPSRCRWCAILGLCSNSSSAPVGPRNNGPRAGGPTAASSTG